MINTLRTKMLLGVMPLMGIMIGLGIWAIYMFARLGNNIDVILRENYQSVRAAQGMKEALERMDSAQWFAIGGEESKAHAQFEDNRVEFARRLNIETHNITLPTEQEMADDLVRLHARYLELADRFFAMSPGSKEERTHFYFHQLLPLFDAIRRRADDVLELNQRNMEQENDRARSSAESSTRLMLVALLASAAVSSAVALGMSRLILEPIRAVTRAAQGMARGELDQVVPPTTRDELGQLAESFNAMARTIRNFRQAGTSRLLRAQKTAQATIDSFPDPVVLVDTAGSVERANPAARKLLGVAPADSPVPWTPPASLEKSLADVLAGKLDRGLSGLEDALSYRDEGQERWFVPRVMAIRDEEGGLLGAAVVLTDITRFRLLDQLKTDMVSTVSHELKTPLTGVQMTIHLLLEEIVGPLVPKQVELLLAARQDSDRLLAIINDLLDLTRIEQGRVRLDCRLASPGDLVSEAMERFTSRAVDAGVSLRSDVEINLPSVAVDRDRVAHIFDNLVGNALAHTPRGGTVRLTAKSEPGVDGVRFVVEDSGEGISPEYLERIFDKFYRVPGSRTVGGAGLGLAIAREIVEAHGGRIEATSRLGHDSAFAFTLPTETAGPVEPGRRQEATSWNP